MLVRSVDFFKPLTPTGTVAHNFFGMCDFCRNIHPHQAKRHASGNVVRACDARARQFRKARFSGCEYARGSDSSTSVSAGRVDDGDSADRGAASSLKAAPGTIGEA